MQKVRYRKVENKKVDTPSIRIYVAVCGEFGEYLMSGDFTLQSFVKEILKKVKYRMSLLSDFIRVFRK